jgi:hypothetical protein
MTEIEESADVLMINYQRCWMSKIIHLFPGIALIAIAVGLFADKSEIPKGDYAAFAPLFLVIMGLASLAAAFFLIARIFDTIKYRFDKTADEFCISGRKYLFKNWATAGMTSEIIGITHEVRETDNDTSSEIFLKFRCYASVTEMLKCGTRNFSEDNNIADIIERFLKRTTDSQPKTS